MFRTYNKMFLRSFFVQSLWNFERLQNIGFLFVLKPFIDDIYKDKEKRKEALMRHTGFFNTHPYMASIIIAVIANIEKEGSQGHEVKDVNFIKNSLAGPLAAIGDSFFWGTVRPVISFVCIFLIVFFTKPLSSSLLAYGALIPLIFLLLYNAIHIPLRYWFLFLGFKLERESVKIISSCGIKILWEALRYLGLLTIVAALIFYFKEFGLSSSVFGIFKGTAPDAVIYGIVLAASVILGRINPTFMFYCAILFCVIMSYTGI
jgi:PTS system mannose-specific IID component